MIPHPLQGTPMGVMLDLCVIFIITSYLLSIITREYSWVDRLWSIAPAIYAVYTAWAEGFADPRLNLVAGLITLWAVRLTGNFIRKGGFWKGGEDYRWEVLQERLGPVGFQLLNITFISPFQLFLIWGFTSPVHAAWLHQDTPLGFLDGVACVMFIVFFLGETIADEQMWRFQQDKAARKARGEEIEAPFFRTGLYTYSRHPNYFCELGMWWMVYVFGVAASGEWLHWTLAGPVALTILFDGSVRFGESISGSKYPSYADYQRTVSRLIPWSPRAAD